VVQLHVDWLGIVPQTRAVLSSKSTKGGRKGAETGSETELAVPAGEVRLPCHLLVEIDGAKTAHCGNDTEQVENPVQLHFGIPIRAL